MTSPQNSPWFESDWLTDQLTAAGCLRRARVTAVSVERIAAEVGFLDSLTRVVPTYNITEPGAPRSVVIKVSSTEETYQRIGNAYHAYEREFHFYEAIAPRAPIRLPQCFARVVDTETGAHILVLEDLGDLTPGDQVAGLTPYQAMNAVEALGRLQAAWWNSPELKTLDWMPTRNLQPARYEAAWEQFRPTVESQLGEESVALGDRLRSQLPQLLNQLHEPPYTIVHSDFRADNLMFDESSTTEPVVIVDWQLAIRGKGVFDVARLLCGSLSPADREACEVVAVHRWHETLVRGGVQDYTFDEALADYRTCVLICLYYPVVIHAAEEEAGRRGKALAHAQIERFFSAAIEWHGDVEQEEPPRAAG